MLQNWLRYCILINVFIWFDYFLCAMLSSITELDSLNQQWMFWLIYLKNNPFIVIKWWYCTNTVGSQSKYTWTQLLTDDQCKGTPHWFRLWNKALEHDLDINTNPVNIVHKIPNRSIHICMPCVRGLRTDWAWQSTVSLFHTYDMVDIQ